MKQSHITLTWRHYCNFKKLKLVGLRLRHWIRHISVSVGSMWENTFSSFIVKCLSWGNVNLKHSFLLCCEYRRLHLLYELILAFFVCFNFISMEFWIGDLSFLLRCFGWWFIINNIFGFFFSCIYNLLQLKCWSFYLLILFC